MCTHAHGLEYVSGPRSYPAVCPLPQPWRRRPAPDVLPATESSVPVDLAAQPRVQPKGKKRGSAHRNSYSSLPGDPVTTDTRFEDPDTLHFPWDSGHFAPFFSHLCLPVLRTPYGADVVPLSLLEIAQTARRSRRCVYKALDHLSHYGFVYLIPTPDGVVTSDDAQRLVCLRVPRPGSTAVERFPPRRPPASLAGRRLPAARSPSCRRIRRSTPSPTMRSSPRSITTRRLFRRSRPSRTIRAPWATARGFRVPGVTGSSWSRPRAGQISIW